MKDGTEISGSEADDILEEARSRFKSAVEAENDNREQALDDLKFLNGEQWDAAAKKARVNRPCLTINRLPSFVRQVVNEQRQTRPAIDVVPADGKASPETARVLQGLIRQIERTSKARLAYDNSFEQQVSCGFGHFRVCTDYADEESLDQVIQIEGIPNPFSVYRDPAAKQPDHSDDRFTFVTEFVDPEEFEEKWGFKPTSQSEQGTGDNVPDWYDGVLVRIAEYWRVVEEDETINVLQTGQVITGKLSKDEKAQLETAGMQIGGSRQVVKRTVESYILCYDKVIKKNEWKGKYIPIMSSYGGQMNIAGKMIISSLIRWAKDPARMYNYMASAETEVTALQPKAPYVGAAGAFDGHENAWTNANTSTVGYLEYNPVPGEAPPQRQMPPQLSQGLREGRMAAAEDIKAVLGMYDASLGARSNETSGVAIKARQMEGDTTTFHFIDNHARAIEQCGRVIIDLIPYIYDQPRVIRILNPTDEQEMAVINQTFIANGQEQMHDMQLGRYDVEVRVGPSFESKRQEMTQAMLELSASNPQLMQIAGDLVVKNMDWPQADEIAQRIHNTVPPAALGQPSPPPPEQALIQAQVQVETIKGQTAQTKSQSDAQIKAMELDIAKQEYQIKQAELELAKIEVAIRSQETGQGMQLDTLKQQVEREKVQVEAAKTVNERMAMQLQAHQMSQSPIVGEDGQPMQRATPMPQADMGAHQAEHEQMMQNMSALIAEIAQLARGLMLPKQTMMITDQSGKPIGSVTQPVGQSSQTLN